MRFTYLICCLLYVLPTYSQTAQIAPVNQDEIAIGSAIIAITNVTIIDGLGGPPIASGAVVIENDRIVAVGNMDEIDLPEEASVYDGQGATLLPGLFDAHFHLNNTIVDDYLRLGITSLRDPGAWMDTYNNVRASQQEIPRLYLTGPHLDMWPPSYPKNSVIIRDKHEADLTVKRFVARGASAIKIYFRCTPEIIEQTCATAREYGIPVTGHLEITDIYQAVRLGINGLEHITSLGTSLVSKREAEVYRQEILADNNARRPGRYRMWSTIDPDAKMSQALAAFLSEQKTFLCPTLGAFEYQAPEEEDATVDTMKLAGFGGMMAYMKTLHKAGVYLVVGSHTWSPYDKVDGAYHNEMELWQKAGIPPAEIIVAATSRNARFFRVERELGSIEVGKIADLFLVNGNPLDDIAKLRDVRRVMLNGVWIDQ